MIKRLILTIALCLAWVSASQAQCLNWIFIQPHGADGSSVTTATLAADTYGGGVPIASTAWCYPCNLGPTPSDEMKYSAAAYQPFSGALPKLCNNPPPATQANLVGYDLTIPDGDMTASNARISFPSYPANISGVQTVMAYITETWPDTDLQVNKDLISLQGSTLGPPTHYHLVTGPSMTVNGVSAVGGSEITISTGGGCNLNQNGTASTLPWHQNVPTLWSTVYSNDTTGTIKDTLATSLFSSTWAQAGATKSFANTCDPVLNQILEFGTQNAQVVHGVRHLYFHWIAICYDSRDNCAAQAVPFIPFNGITLETAADGSGSLISSQTLSSGQTLGAYCIQRTPGGAFLSNVACTFSLSAKTGGVTNANLVAAGDNKSAVFTAVAPGSAVISAYDTHTVAGNTGTLAALGAASGLPVYRFIP